MDNIITVKVTLETRRLLRLIAAHTERTAQEVAEDLAKREWERVKREEAKEDERETV